MRRRLGGVTFVKGINRRANVRANTLPSRRSRRRALTFVVTSVVTSCGFHVLGILCVLRVSSVSSVPRVMHDPSSRAVSTRTKHNATPRSDVRTYPGATASHAALMISK